MFHLALKGMRINHLLNSCAPRLIAPIPTCGCCRHKYTTNRRPAKLIWNRQVDVSAAALDAGCFRGRERLAHDWDTSKKGGIMEQTVPLQTAVRYQSGV